MLTKGTQPKVSTIEQYAHYVLDDPQVKAFIDDYKKYQRVADRIIDSFEGQVDQGILTFDNEEDLKAARVFNRNSEGGKQVTLMLKVRNMIPEAWSKEKLKNIMGRDASQPHPNITDIPLIMFKSFATTKDFDEYLPKGSISALSGAYFSKEIDLARQKYLVFALYLWLFFNAKYTAKGDLYYKDVYKDMHVSEITGKIDGISIQRVEFLRQFKDYIHFDLLRTEDYEKNQKKGAVLRLSLDRPETGFITIQKCGDSSLKCNYTLTADRENTNYLVKEYLGPNPILELQKLGTFLSCDNCAKQAYFMASLNKETQYYCDMKCFNRCKK